MISLTYLVPTIIFIPTKAKYTYVSCFLTFVHVSKKMIKSSGAAFSRQGARRRIILLAFLVPKQGDIQKVDRVEKYLLKSRAKLQCGFLSAFWQWAEFSKAVLVA